MIVHQMLSKLFFIKSIHSLIFILMSACVIYILYSGIIKNYHWTVFVAIGAVLVEGVALIFNNWQCPLTTLARKYGDEKGSVTDMFLPEWLSRHVFIIFPALFAIGLILLGLNYGLR